MSYLPPGINHGDVCFVYSGETRPAENGDWHCDAYTDDPGSFSRWTGPQPTKVDRAILVKYEWNAEAEKWEEWA